MVRKRSLSDIPGLVSDFPVKQDVVDPLTPFVTQSVVRDAEVVSDHRSNLCSGLVKVSGDHCELFWVVHVSDRRQNIFLHDELWLEMTIYNSKPRVAQDMDSVGDSRDCYEFVRALEELGRGREEEFCVRDLLSKHVMRRSKCNANEIV
jgi:hypothetical protein